MHGCAKAEAGVSECNRRGRYYQLTAAGRKQLAGERAEFERMVRAIQDVLEATWWGGLNEFLSSPAGISPPASAARRGAARGDGSAPRAANRAAGTRRSDA